MQSIGASRLNVLTTMNEGWNTVFLERDITCLGQEGIWEVPDGPIKQQLREVYGQALKADLIKR